MTPVCRAGTASFWKTTTNLLTKRLLLPLSLLSIARATVYQAKSKIPENTPAPDLTKVVKHLKPTCGARSGGSTARTATLATLASYGVDAKRVLPVKEWRNADKEMRERPDHERRVFDATYASHDGSNRHMLAWIKGPEVDLAEGRHRLRIEVKPGKHNKGFGAMDCFVLAEEGFRFRPRMFYKPDQRVNTVPELDPADACPFPRCATTSMTPPSTCATSTRRKPANMASSG